MRRRTVALAIGTIAALASACQILIGIGEDKFTVVTEAGAADAGDDAGPGCQQVQPIARPEGVEDGVSLPPLLFAMRTTQVTGRSDAGVPVGFDVDRVCTCAPNDRSPHDGGTSCRPPPNALSRDGCDEDGGVDNASLKLFELFGRLPEFSSFAEAMSRQTECGRLNLLIFVRGYNGTANDPKIDLLAMESFGIREPHDAGDPDNEACGYFAGGPKLMGPFPARFDGTDRWSVRTNSVTRPPGGNPEPTRPTGAGWVTNWHIVYDGRIGGGPATVPIIFGNNVLNIGTPIMVARIVPVDAAGADIPIGPDNAPLSTPVSYRLADGIFVGRSSLNDMISRLGALEIGPETDGDQRYFCSEKNQFLYVAVKTNVCAAPDIMADPRDDFAGQECDALSLNLQFTATKASFGMDYDPEVPDGGCGPGWQDRCR
jgi:hypothetical protein